MATVNGVLQTISSNLFIKYDSPERNYIDKRIDILKTRLKEYFNIEIKEIFIFGSYARETILPRKFDENSDIDILIVFDNTQKNYTPETYRNKIRRFAEKKYPRTKIAKDHPSIVLEMHGIKFDLVACRFDIGWVYDSHQIPDKLGGWMDTYPNEFSEKLTKANVRYNSIVKPIIRLLKRWNAFNNYPYSSYDLEQIIADMNFNKDNYQTGFLYAITKLPENDLPIIQSKKVQRLKRKGELINNYLLEENQEKAIEIVCNILGIRM